MLLALLLVFIVLGVMQYFMPKPKPPQPENISPQQQAQQTPATKQPTPSATSAAVAKSTPAPAVAKVAAKAAAAETEAVLETENYRITFTNRGASVKSWILKKYKDDAGKLFDLVNQTVAPQLGNTLSFFTFDKDLEKK